MSKTDRQYFFVQPARRELWHVESDDNCEIMLCGYFISVNLETVRIQYQWGPRKCPDCFILFEKREHDAA